MNTLSGTELAMAAEVDLVAVPAERAQLGQQLLAVFHVRIINLVTAEEAVDLSPGTNLFAGVGCYSHFKGHVPRHCDVLLDSRPFLDHGLPLRHGRSFSTH